MKFAQVAVSRRALVKATVGMASALTGHSLLTEMLAAKQAPALHRAASTIPQLAYGVASGDVRPGEAVIWSKSDRPARMIVEYATTASMKNLRRVTGPIALETTDFTAKLNLRDLPPDQEIFYRVQFQSLEELRVLSEPTSGHLRTPPATKRNLSFLWSGDTAGQGWGINPEWGGMKIYAQMAKLQPDFFIHSGDTIYADNPINAEVKLPDGSLWRNLTTPAKAKVAETLDEFRGNFVYNLLDEHVRAFNASVPVIAQWDDHEVHDNWYLTQVLDDDRYQVKSVALLAARANRAFMEYNPIRTTPDDPERIFRVIPYGPLLDVFVLDMRAYRAANGLNHQARPSAETAFLGREQLRWLKQALLASTATWKVIAIDQSLGLIVYNNFRDKSGSEAMSNGDGPVLGREHETADLLRFLKANAIHNVVFITADVHYTAAHYYDPNKAQFGDFNPFYEFVSGPLNAGTFGPNPLDNTFGPQVLYQKVPEPGAFNLPPSAGLQFFGQVQIDGASEVMTVTLRDLSGAALYTQKIEPVLS